MTQLVFARKLRCWPLLAILCSAAVAQSHAADSTPVMSGGEQAVSEIVISYGGGPLPAEALHAPEGTVVKLEWNEGAPTGAAEPDAAADLPEIVADPAGGPLPHEAMNPPEGVVVKVKAPREGASYASTRASDAPPELPAVVMECAKGTLAPEALVVPDGSIVKLKIAAKPRNSSANCVGAEVTRATATSELVVEWPKGPLPPEALNPPEGKVVKLKLSNKKGAKSAGGPTLELAAAPAMPELVISYSGGPLPDEALHPPEGVVVKLRDERN